MGKTSKRHLENQTKNTQLTKATDCALDVEVSEPHSSRPSPALGKKCNTCEKVGHFSKKCRSKPQQNSGQYSEQNIFCEENSSSEQSPPSPASETGMCYTKEQIFSMPAIWEVISLKNCQVKVQLDTGADSSDNIKNIDSAW